MSIESLLKNQARIVMEQYKAFEELRRMFERESGDSSAFSGGEEAPSPELEVEDPPAEGYENYPGEWAAYMARYAQYEVPSDFFPASLTQVESEIDPDSMSMGKPMGIPIGVWVHQRGAGRLIPELEWDK